MVYIIMIIIDSSSLIGLPFLCFIVNEEKFAFLLLGFELLHLLFRVDVAPGGFQIPLCPWRSVVGILHCCISRFSFRILCQPGWFLAAFSLETHSIVYICGSLKFMEGDVLIVHSSFKFLRSRINLFFYDTWVIVTAVMAVIRRNFGIHFLFI